MKARQGIGMDKMTDDEKKQFDEIMKHCRFSHAQLDNLDKAMVKA